MQIAQSLIALQSCSILFMVDYEELSLHNLLCMRSELTSIRSKGTKFAIEGN